MGVGPHGVRVRPIWPIDFDTVSSNTPPVRVFCDYCAYKYLAQADEDLSDLTTQQLITVVRRTYTNASPTQTPNNNAARCCACTASLSGPSSAMVANLEIMSGVECEQMVKPCVHCGARLLIDSATATTGWQASMRNAPRAVTVAD